MDKKIATTNIQISEASDTNTPKKPYESPVLTTHGTLLTLTQDIFPGSPADGLGDPLGLS